jgi:hypothetical protein
MKKSPILVILTLLFVFSLFFTPSHAQADQVIKAKRHSDAFSMMGQSQPAKDEEVTTWLTKNKMRRDEGDTTTIVRYDLNKIYWIDNAKKTYSELDLPLDMETMLPPQAKQMLDQMEVTSSVTDTGETKTINNWNCKKYLVEIGVSMMGMNMPIKMDFWTSKDLGIDEDMYKKFYAETLSLNPMFKDMVEEFKKIEGYPVRTDFTMNIMGNEQHYWEEVASVEKMDAPAGTYDLPEGYTKTEFNPFQQQR